MSAGHTSGPWEWDAGLIPPDGPGRYSDIYVVGEDNELIIIAEFNDSIPEGRANARLITAAPELLDAAQIASYAIAQYLDEPVSLNQAGLYSALKKLDAAISKATGATS